MGRRDRGGRLQDSTDATREIAEAAGARVITNAWPGFGAQKQFAVEQAKHEWIFSLDADERVSDELKNSIESLRKARNRARRWLPDRSPHLLSTTLDSWRRLVS